MDEQHTGLVQESLDHEPIPVHFEGIQEVLAYVQEVEIWHGPEKVRVQVLQAVLLQVNVL